MILVDTSVWIDHLRNGNKQLGYLLNGVEVLGHPFVTGELACGNMSNRSEVLELLAKLPTASVATPDETLFLIEQHQLMGSGIGYIDAHLLASVSLTAPAKIWTLDKRLSRVAIELGVAHTHH